MTDDEDFFAAEVALGLADDAGADAARVEWWRAHFAMLDAGEAVPSDALWGRIAARLPVNDNSGGAVRRWQWASGGFAALAAVLLGVIVLQDKPVSVPVTPVAARAPIVASLSGRGGVALTVSYDARDGRVLVTPVSLDAREGDTELWVIPVGGKPVSLGVIDAHAAASHDVMRANRALLVPGATFAVSREPTGGSPTGQPTGPVVASGTIIRA